MKKIVLNLLLVLVCANAFAYDDDILHTLGFTFTYKNDYYWFNSYPDIGWLIVNIKGELYTKMKDSKIYEDGDYPMLEELHKKFETMYYNQNWPVTSEGITRMPKEDYDTLIKLHNELIEKNVFTIQELRKFHY